MKSITKTLIEHLQIKEKPALLLIDNKYPLIKYLIVFLVLVYAITTLTFSKVSSDEFIFIHDEFLILTKQDAKNLFIVRHDIDLNVPSYTHILITFFDRLYYFIMFSFGFSIHSIQPFLLFLKLILILYIPFIGFKKLYKLYNLKKDDFVPFLVSLWYAFNLFTLIYWNGNFFALTLLLCYALAPLGIYTYHETTFTNSNKTQLIQTAIIIFLMSFALPFFIVFLTFLALYTLLLLVKDFKVFPRYLKNISSLIILCIPFTLFYGLLIRDMYYVTADTVNLTGGETYTQLLGGLFYPFIMWFSWAIYSYWEPRNIFTFYAYFRSFAVLLSPFLIYSLILFGVYKIKNSRYIPTFLLIFLILIFFIKGVQPPFGELFQYLIDNVGFFRVFRSPDSKFGFGIILTLCLLLLVTSVSIKRKLFTIIMVSVVLIQGYYIYTGTAFIGENTPYSSDRVIKVPADYYALKSYLDSADKNKSTYILSIPPIAFGHYNFENNKVHIGQDILPLIINRPFIYESEYSSMLKSTNDKIKKALYTPDLSLLSEFPIKYILLRKDLTLDKRSLKLKEYVQESLSLVYSNSSFDLYEQSKLTEVIDTAGVGSYKKIHPAKYIVTNDKELSNTATINLMLNYHADWILVPITSTREVSFFNFKELLYPYVPSSKLYKNELKFNYANSWKVDSVTNSYSDSKLVTTKLPKHTSYVLYFKTQAYLYSIIIVVFLYLLVLLGVLYKIYKKQ